MGASRRATCPRPSLTLPVAMASGAYCARERYPPTRSSSCWARSNRTGPGRSQSSPYPWIVGSVVLAIIALLLVIAAQVMHQARLDQSHPADAIVVFGAAEYVGRPRSEER